MERPTMSERMEGIRKFMWDSENGTVLGRGAKSWAEIGVFYLIYYACLASFFAATLAVFYETLKDSEPKLMSDSSLLNGNPGMGFRPRIDLKDPKIKAKSKGKNSDYTEDIDKFLEPYRNTKVHYPDCNMVTEPRTSETEACGFDMAVVDTHCPPTDGYGFNDGAPCVVIKLNKVYGWVPSMWDDVSDSPIKPKWGITYKPSVIPLRCFAKDSDDQAKLGELSYYPEQGFPVKYFPYKNQKNYLSPLVFVKFNSTDPGNTIEVECRAYAKNIEYEPTENSGLTRFTIRVD